MRVEVDLDVNEYGTLFCALGAWCARLQQHGEVPAFYWTLLDKLAKVETEKLTTVRDAAGNIVSQFVDKPLPLKTTP